MSTLADFWNALADAIGVRQDARAPYVDFVSRWQPHEGGWTANSAAFNPLNTTLQFGASKGINSVGVQSYTDFSSGVAATAETLKERKYSNLLYALQSGDYSRTTAIQGDINMWVTGSRTGSTYSLFGSPDAPANPAPDIPAGWPFGNPGNIPLWPGGPTLGDVAGGIRVPKPPTPPDILPGGDSSPFPDLGSIAHSIAGLPGVLLQMVKVFAWLLDPRHWFRLFFIALGAGMVAIGAYIYVRGDKAPADAAKIAEVAA